MRLSAAPVVGFTSGLAKEAADYLIRVRNCRPVYNMAIYGKDKEGLFKVNSQTMTTDQMIAYAVERGFDPKASMS